MATGGITPNTDKLKIGRIAVMAAAVYVLFVSHSIQQIREMCNRVLWIDGGTMRMIGSTQEVCDAYSK